MFPPTRIVRLRNPGFPHRGFFVVGPYPRHRLLADARGGS
jgi:hypothetical protein